MIAVVLLFLAMTFSQHHMYGYVCRCGLQMLDIRLFLNTPHPYLVPILFHQFISTISLHFQNFFPYLVRPLAILNYLICHHQHHATLILTVLCI